VRKLLPLLLVVFACASRPAIERRPIAARPADQLATRTPDEIKRSDTRSLGKLKPVPGAAKMLDERDRRPLPEPGAKP